MKHARRRLVVALGVLAGLVAAVPLAAGHNDRPRHGARGSEVVGYFTSWGIYARQYRVKDVATSGSADRLTAVNYAFGNLVPEGAPGNVVCKLGDEWADYQTSWTAEQSVSGTEITWPRPILGNFQQLQALKALHPNVKVLISLGGWTWSQYFSDAALTRESRSRFVASCIDLFIKGNLPDPGWGGMGGPGPRPACSTVSISTGSGRDRRATPTTSSAPRTSTTSPFCSRSSASSWTRTASRQARTTC